MEQTGMKDSAGESVLVAMSGGVDSSVTACLALASGYAGVGCMMLLPTESSDADTTDARLVCEKLGMPFHILDYRAEFREKVIGRFVGQYLAGKTPNPCIDCNRLMKFGRLFEEADKLGCEKIATGHYARVEKTADGYFIKKAIDETKDQSYVLYQLTQKQLARLLLPLGEYRKTEVREIAAKRGFRNASRSDSQDICFVPDGDYARVIGEWTATEPPAGDFLDLAGRVIGRHRGIIHYTLGQRRGLGIAGGEPLYVVKISARDNTVTLGPAEALFRRDARVGNLTWALGEMPADTFRCRAKTRYRQREQEVTVTRDGAENVRLLFDEPQRAVTPGQSAVFYLGDTVIGGGEILPYDD